ncbi:DNA repair protein RadC [Candidatus Gribaldobacteria bacterium]|nr:DNA repair protein RadC [Candidatus Gribaldobacteria bacterium]
MLINKKTIKTLPKSERPREKLIERGVKNLKDEELLAILLSTGVKGKNVVKVAEELLKKYPKAKLFKLSFVELAKNEGVGQAKACVILAAQELVKRALEIKDEIAPKIVSVEDIVAQAIYMRDKQREHFMVLYLNGRNELIFKKPMFVGTLNANLVHPREIFLEALKQNAACLVFCHNHPSGDPTPSKIDLEVTNRLVEAGKIMGIDVLDHLIISKTRVFSFRESGLFN